MDFRNTLAAAAVGACAAVALAQPAQASLAAFKTFTGTVAVSTDAFGSTANSGSVTINAPTGSTVLGAYLYTSTYSNPSLSGVGGTIDGNALGSFTNLGTDLASCCSLTAARWDVTSYVKGQIEGSASTSFNFALTETDFRQDGMGLVVVYSNAALPTATVGILDGFATVLGDTTSINFINPLAPTDPGFFAEMRLGIGFSCCDTQRSTVEVNDIVMTENAGNNDDSTQPLANGNLYTLGGDDDPLSPANPTYLTDHERYDLTPFITAGDTSIKIDTINASRDDLIHVAIFHVSGIAGINEDPNDPTGVPEPATLALLGMGLLGLGIARRRKA